MEEAVPVVKEGGRMGHRWVVQIKREFRGWTSAWPFDEVDQAILKAEAVRGVVDFMAVRVMHQITVSGFVSDCHIDWEWWKGWTEPALHGSKVCPILTIGM